MSLFVCHFLCVTVYNKSLIECNTAWEIEICLFCFVLLVKNQKIKFFTNDFNFINLDEEQATPNTTNSCHKNNFTKNYKKQQQQPAANQ